MGSHDGLQHVLGTLQAAIDASTKRNPWTTGADEVDLRALGRRADAILDLTLPEYIQPLVGWYMRMVRLGASRAQVRMAPLVWVIVCVCVCVH